MPRATGPGKGKSRGSSEISLYPLTLLQCRAVGRGVRVSFPAFRSPCRFGASRTCNLPGGSAAGRGRGDRESNGCPQRLPSTPSPSLARCHQTLDHRLRPTKSPTTHHRLLLPSPAVKPPAKLMQRDRPSSCLQPRARNEEKGQLFRALFVSSHPPPVQDRREGCPGFLPRFPYPVSVGELPGLQPPGRVRGREGQRRLGKQWVSATAALDPFSLPRPVPPNPRPPRPRPLNPPGPIGRLLLLGPAVTPPGKAMQGDRPSGCLQPFAQGEEKGAAVPGSLCILSPSSGAGL